MGGFLPNYPSARSLPPPYEIPGRGLGSTLKKSTMLRVGPDAGVRHTNRLFEVQVSTEIIHVRILAKSFCPPLQTAKITIILWNCTTLNKY